MKSSTRAKDGSPDFLATTRLRQWEHVQGEEGLTSHDNGDQRHQDRQHDSREKTTDNSHDYMWDLGQPFKPNVAFKVRNV